jgi:crotonobetainyl-CoA:carnitine CoA-transferase CaiB-like acyl-CoA transferase
MTGLLSDLRVIDLSRGPAGGLATTILADFGADVIKVEPPGGDPLRRLPNAPLWLRGKRSVALDLPAERERLHALLQGADVLVTSCPPDEAALGLDGEALAGANPGLVHCAISGWGPRGPYAAYPAREPLVAARSGRMMVFRGLVRREGPAYAAVQVATHACAQAAVQGILAALLARERLGRGQRVETSLLQGMLPYDTAGLPRVQFAAQAPQGSQADFADAPDRMPTLNYHPIMTADGRWIQLGNLLEHLFYAYLAAADLTELLTDGRYQGQPARWPVEVREAARDRMLGRMLERTADEWMEVFRANGNVAAEPFATTQEALTNPELTRNGDVVEVEHARRGRMRWLGPLARLEATPAHIRATEPLPGEHTAAVLAEPPRPAWRASGPAREDGRPPLEGVTVLEFATIIAAPLGASLLADLGARVIKVEPLTGDPGRALGGGPGGGFGSLRYNAGKESICIDLKMDDGQEVVRRLLAKADIVIHNYRPGVPERLGIGYEQARRLNPRVVYLSANGYGPDAPGALRPSAHPIPGAMVGGALFQAGAGMPPTRCESLAEVREAARRLMRANEVNPDPSTAVVIATAALLGLYGARRRGLGQRVYVNMMGANAWANHDDALSYAGKPPRPTVDADVYGLHALHRLYPARAGWVFLCVEGDAEWRTLCRVAGWDDLAADARFATAADRQAHDGALAAALLDRFAAREADAWEALLIAAGVGGVRADAGTPGQFWLGDPHARANGFVVEAEHPELGTYTRHGPLVTFARTPARCGPGSLPGHDTDAILTELGYDAETIAGLHARRIVGGRPESP